MTTIDSLLVKIMSLISEDVKKTLPKKDLKVLTNLSQSVLNPSFITESQSKLLIKILGIHMNKFDGFSDEIENVLQNPSWSKNFRPVDQVKKIYSKSDRGELSLLVIETHYSSEIKKALKDINEIVGLTQPIKNPKTHICYLNEKNLVVVIEKLQPLGFEIQNDLLTHYSTIKSWVEDEVRSQFLVYNIDNSNFIKKFTEDIPEQSLNELLVADRSIRYQYYSEFSKKTGENLAESIAYRETPTMWVDKKSYTVDDILMSLIELNRLPVVFVFDSHDSEKCLQDLKILNESLEKNGIFDGVGIYFRLDNTDIGKEFNHLIAEKKYNAQLNSFTKVIGIQNGKIPKFFLKNDWKPMSLVSLRSYLKNSKTAVFAESCDLILIHSENKPLDFMRVNTWQ